MKRIFHQYELWEDFNNGFYEIISGKQKEDMINKVIYFFNNPDLVEIYMDKVINEWVFSCEQNLTNPNLNKIAYIGQSACCIYANIPCSITMNAWNKIDIEYRLIADKIALKKIKEWEQNQKSKSILASGKEKDIQTEYQMKFPFH